jgi:hypothetical protein|tara:strand:- start:755 stop:1012 length:258 start_codon:yes stop_codon:yes gene_type:complete
MEKEENTKDYSHHRSIGYFIKIMERDEELIPKNFIKLKKAPKNNGVMTILILCTRADYSKRNHLTQVGHGPGAVVKKTKAYIRTT